MSEIWIQLENRPWDTMPNNIDRMTGKNSQAITTHASEMVTITSPDAAGTGIRVSQSRRMYAPLRDGSGKVMDALIFRRYKAPDKAKGIAEWQVPDDRKVNAWDINEKDPTDSGTMGTIPGPPVECNVGESVTVHFRNLDLRLTKNVKARTHSMHVHGFVFKQEHDGAYPLSNADPTQRVDGSTPNPGQLSAPDETSLWNSIAPAGSSTFGALKIGDRVPPRGTFAYTWNTFGWPSTTGVWLYHDHSFCDMENMGLGAIGMVVIHNTSDTQNDFPLTAADLPDQDFNGNPISVTCFPFQTHLALDKSLLARIGNLDEDFLSILGHKPSDPMNMGKDRKNSKAAKKEMDAPDRMAMADVAHLIQQGDFLLRVTKDLGFIRALCRRNYKTPPVQAQYLQLFHKLTSSPGMNINGRTYLGNTPSVVAGVNTKMRFGVVGMGGVDGTHTFHIHGHRWIIPGPHGNSPGAIQGSVLDTPVSQFEDTRIFGPANSFVFFINGASGSFMRAGGPSSDNAKGEWHMHCHVLDHMMSGMMGSLIIVGAGDPVSLPRGEECPSTDVTPAATIDVKFGPLGDHVVPSGTVVTFNFVETFHTITTVSKTGIINSIEINGGAASPNVAADSGVATPLGPRTVLMTGNMGDKVNFQCGIHFAPMVGSITIGM